MGTLSDDERDDDSARPWYSALRALGPRALEYVDKPVTHLLLLLLNLE